MADINQLALKIFEETQMDSEQEIPIVDDIDPIDEPTTSVAVPITDDLNEKALNIFSAAGGLNRETKEAPEEQEEKRVGSNLMSRATVAGISMPKSEFGTKGGIFQKRGSIADTLGDVGEFFTGTFEDIKKRGATVMEELKDISKRGEVTTESFLTPIGQGLGTVSDIIGNVVITAGKIILPQDAEEALADAFGATVKGIGNLKDKESGMTLGEAIGIVSEEFQKLDSEKKTALIAGGNALGFVTDILGLRFGKTASKTIIAEFRNKLAITKDKKAVLQKAIVEKKIPLEEVEKIAKEFGIELPASSTAKPLGARIEQSLGEGLFGGKIKERVDTALLKFDEATTKIQSKAKTSGELGEDIAGRFKKVESSRRKTINNLYDIAEDLGASSEIGIFVPDDAGSIKLLDEIISRKTIAKEAGVDVASEIKILENLKNGLAKNRDIKSYRAVLREVGDKANFKSFTPTTEEKTMRSLYGKLKEDINSGITDSFPQLKEALDTANKSFKEFEFIKSRPFIQKIQKLSDAKDFDKIAEALTKTSVSSNEIKIMYEVLGDEVAEQIQKKFLSNIIEKSRSATGEGFTPAGFSRQIKSIGNEKLDAIFSPANRKALKELDTLNTALARATAVGKGSQTAILQALVPRIIGGIATGGTSLLAEFVLSRFFAGKVGQNLLKNIGKKSFNKAKTQLTKIK